MLSGSKGLALASVQHPEMAPRLLLLFLLLLAFASSCTTQVCSSKLNCFWKCCQIPEHRLLWNKQYLERSGSSGNIVVEFIGTGRCEQAQQVECGKRMQLFLCRLWAAVLVSVRSRDEQWRWLAAAASAVQPAVALFSHCWSNWVLKENY